VGARRRSRGGRGSTCCCHDATDEEASENPHEKSPATVSGHEACDDSRGGTRTHDPGIMSAVL
jgi:hypothetical protein